MATVYALLRAISAENRGAPSIRNVMIGIARRIAHRDARGRRPSTCAAASAASATRWAALNDSEFIGYDVGIWHGCLL